MTAYALGLAGERAVRAVYNIGPMKLFIVFGRQRIPDGVTGSAISEVNNRAYQALTLQLRDYVEIAHREELRFDLYLRSNTQVSGPLQQLIDHRVIHRKVIPGT